MHDELQVTILADIVKNISSLIYICTHARSLQQEVSISLPLCVGQVKQAIGGFNNLFSRPATDKTR